MSGMQTSSDTDDRDEVLELLRVEIVRLEQELAQALNVAQLMKRPDDEGAPGDGENPVQDTSNVSTNSDSIVETMKRDISRLERELAEASWQNWIPFPIHLSQQALSALPSSLRRSTLRDLK